MTINYFLVEEGENGTRTFKLGSWANCNQAHTEPNIGDALTLSLDTSNKGEPTPPLFEMFYRVVEVRHIAYDEAHRQTNIYISRV